MTKNQALNILRKLIRDLHAYANQRVNVHKPINNQAETIDEVFKELESRDTGAGKITEPTSKYTKGYKITYATEWAWN